MKNPISFVATLVVITAWIPLAYRFFASWRQRRNPISLAICTLIGLFCYTLAGVNAAKADFIELGTLEGLLLGFGVLVAVNFYVSFMWSKQRFPDSRSKG